MENADMKNADMDNTQDTNEETPEEQVDGTIRNLLVTYVTEMDMHRANSGRNRLGNASAIKQRPDGKVYISGQMQRHAFFESLRRQDERDDQDEKDETYVSPGDGTTYHVEKDLRADLGGFFHPEIFAAQAKRRTSPMSATAAVAREESNTVQDLLLRLSGESNGDNNIATMQTSQSDRMVGSFSLDLTALTISRAFEYGEIFDGEDRGVRVGEREIPHQDEAERRRRARLFLEAIQHLGDYASQARNMVSGSPDTVLISVDTRVNRKPAKYFKGGNEAQQEDPQQEAIRREVESRDGRTFLGSDGGEGQTVEEAFEAAKQTIRDGDFYHPALDEEDREAIGFDSDDSDLDFPRYEDVFEIEQREDDDE
jgi:CRISPR-associated protein Cst2